MAWYQSRYGRRVEMAFPTADQVDFAEICGTLAQINRYAGAAHLPVSVGLHSLIADDIAARHFPRARPWAILHDFHEARIGDVTTPTKDALCEIAEAMWGSSHVITSALHELKLRHDHAIYEAAGIHPPTPKIVAEVKLIDLMAMNVERQFHLAEPPEPWDCDGLALAQYDGYFPGMYGNRPCEIASTLYRRLVRVLAAYHDERALRAA